MAYLQHKKSGGKRGFWNRLFYCGPDHGVTPSDESSKLMAVRRFIIPSQRGMGNGELLH